MPVLNNKKVHWLFQYVYNAKFAVFQVLCCVITCKRVLFPSINVCFHQLAQISEIDNRLVTARIVKIATGVQCQCSTLEKVRLCPFVSVGVFVCVRHNQSGYLMLKTTEVKLILEVILFYVRKTTLNITNKFPFLLRSVYP